MGAVVIGARRLASAASEAVLLFGPNHINLSVLREAPSEASHSSDLLRLWRPFNFKASKLIEGSIFQWSNSNTKLLSDL